MHCHWVITLNEDRLPAAAYEIALDLLMRDTREDSRVADLVSIQVQNRKNGSVCDRVQELIGLP